MVAVNVELGWSETALSDGDGVVCGQHGLALQRTPVLCQHGEEVHSLGTRVAVQLAHDY